MAGIPRAGDGPRARRSCRRSSASGRCSTTWAPCSTTRRSAAQSRPPPAPGWCCGRSCRAASSIARARPTHARRTGSSRACGMHFWRFLRLGLVASWCTPSCSAASTRWLFDELYPRLTRDVTVERTAFAIRLGCYAVFGAAAGRLQPDLRLRADPHRRRGSPQRDRRRSSRAPGSSAATAALFWLYLAERRSVPLLVRGLRGARSGRARSGLAEWLSSGLGQAVYPAASLSEAAVLGVGDGVLPGGARARVLYCGARRSCGRNRRRRKRSGMRIQSARMSRRSRRRCTSRVFKNARILIVDDEDANIEMLRADPRARRLHAAREHQRLARGGAALCRAPARPDPARPAHAASGRARGDGPAERDRRGHATCRS